MSVCSHGSLPLADGTIHLQLIGRLQIWLGIGPTYSWLKCKIPCSLEYRTMSTCVALGLLEWVSMLASAALSVVVPGRGVLDFILRVALGSRWITFCNPLRGSTAERAKSTITEWGF